MTIIIDGDLSRPVLAKAEGLLPHAFAAASHMPPLSSRRELGKKSAGRGTGEPHLLMWPNLSGPKVVDFVVKVARLNWDLLSGYLGISNYSRWNDEAQPFYDRQEMIPSRGKDTTPWRLSHRWKTWSVGFARGSF